MKWIAWRMLIGDRGKYVGLVLGLSFAALLIAQQSSIFCGWMLMTASQIRDTQSANIWRFRALCPRLRRGVKWPRSILGRILSCKA
jgi:hypothetical protein